MELERELAARISRDRRRSRAARGAFFAVLGALCIAVIVLVIVPYAAGSTELSPLVTAAGGAGRVAALAAVALVLDVVFALLYIPGVVRDRRYYAKLTSRAGEYDARRLAMFMNALDGARLKAGVDEPPVAVLASSSPNALTFEGHGGKAVVGVTRGLLESDLSYKEAEAVMAHQLAGIIASDYLRKPGTFGFELAAYGLLGLFSLLGLAAAPMVGAGGRTGLGVAFLAGAAAVLFLGGLVVRRLRRPDSQDYLLADSVAAGVTGKPEALAEAIRKLDSLVNGKARGQFPDNELGLKYFFVCPYRFSETAAAFFARRKRELEWKTTDALADRQTEGVQAVMDELAEYGEALVAERLANLQAGAAGLNNSDNSC